MDEKVVTVGEIAQRVTSLGYNCEHVRTVGPKSGRSAGSSTLDVEVTGMSCTSCSGKVGRWEGWVVHGGPADMVIRLADVDLPAHVSGGGAGE